MNREKIYNTLFATITDRLSTVPVTDEPHTLTSLTYVVDWSTRFMANISVVNAANNVALTEIFSGTPSANQYLCNNGVYTFSVSNMGASLLVSYTFKGIITSSKRLLHWSDVSPADQPAMYLTKKSETCEKIRGLPSKWTQIFELYLYVNTSNDPGVIPASLMNPILDEVDNLFRVDDFANYSLTLNGLVSHVAINGEMITDEGVLGDQAICIVPIEILVPT